MGPRFLRSQIQGTLSNSSVLVGSSLFALLSIREINRLHQLLREQALKDTLTGLFNRSLLLPSLEQAISRSRRTQKPMTLVCVDIDRFLERWPAPMPCDVTPSLNGTVPNITTAILPPVMPERDFALGSLLGLCFGAGAAIVMVAVTAPLFRPFHFADSAVCLALVVLLSVLPKRFSHNTVRVGGYAASLVALVATAAINVVRQILAFAG